MPQPTVGASIHFVERRKHPQVLDGLAEQNLYDINLEDIGIVEKMQRGRSSPGYVNPRFSPYHERCVHSFETRIANAVGLGLGMRAA
jgi:hypothetical protein